MDPPRLDRRRHAKDQSRRHRVHRAQLIRPRPVDGHPSAHRMSSLGPHCDALDVDRWLLRGQEATLLLVETGPETPHAKRRLGCSLGTTSRGISVSCVGGIAAGRYVNPLGDVTNSVASTPSTAHTSTHRPCCSCRCGS
jgi:hypothetical protein